MGERIADSQAAIRVGEAKRFDSFVLRRFLDKVLKEHLNPEELRTSPQRNSVLRKRFPA